MATLAAKRADISRKPIWLLKLILDQCTLENGVGPCTATEQCYFTRETTKDATNYAKGTFEWTFLNRGGWKQLKKQTLTTPMKPLLKTPKKLLPTKLNTDKFKTERGQMQFELMDDTESAKANPNKSTTQDGTGSLWPNLIKRNPNFHLRPAELYQGYDEMDLADFQLMFRGVIENIEVKDNGVIVTARDLLWRAGQQELPVKTSSTNILTAGINAVVAVIPVTDEDQFNTPAPTTNEPRVVKIEDEIITYTGVSGADDLTGCTRGSFGTTAAVHAVDTEVKQVEYYGVNNAADTAWSDVVGLPADHLFMDLIVQHAGIDPDYIKVVDQSVTLNGAIIAGDTTIAVNNVVNLPFEGVVKIESEFIRYTNVTTTSLTGCLRGMYGTTAAGHADTTAVKPTTFTDELGTWIQGFRYRARFESSKKVNERIKTLMASTLAMIWQNEDGEIQCNFLAPPLLGAAPKEITDTDIIHLSRKIDINEDERATRVVVFYNANKADPGNKQADLPDIFTHIDRVAESADFFNEIKDKEVFSEWIYRTSEAGNISSKRFSRLRGGVPILGFGLELREDDTVTGDVVKATTDKVVDENGVAEQRDYQVISKERIDNRLNFLAQESGFGDKRYMLIGPLNGILDANISDVIQTIDIDLSGTDLVHADFRTGGTHALGIEDEIVTYTTATDQGGDVTRFTGMLRGQDGTANVAHLAGVDIRINYSAAEDDYRSKYWSIGSVGDPDAGNLLDANGDFTETDPGYLIF